MKTRNLFAFAAFALSLSLAACDSYQPVVAGQETQSGDRACRIESFVLTLGNDAELRGDVYDYDKTIDIGYDVLTAPFLDEATAAYTISKGASILPDPAVARDYSVPVEFTVTAPDGVTKRVYTTNPVERIVETYVKASEFIAKSAVELGIDLLAATVGISGDCVVVNTKVFNAKTLAAVGTLNTTGLEGKVPVWSGNDDAGHLVSVFNESGNMEDGPSSIAVWRDGWDKAPHLQANNSGSAWGKYFSVSGNMVEGQGIITAQGAASAESGTHHLLTLTDGVHAYSQITTALPSNDGVWGQMLSAASGDPAGAWFCWDSATGTTNIYAGEDWKPGATPTMALLTGTAANGSNLWGNYTRGSLKAFMFDGKAYCLTLTTGWPCTYVSIVDAENKFVLSSTDSGATMNYAAGYNPKGTYIFDEEENCGYVYVFIPGYELKVWRLELAVL